MVLPLQCEDGDVVLRILWFTRDTLKPLTPGIDAVVLEAKQNIGIGMEITYDYGDRSKESLKANPWLANPSRGVDFNRRSCA